MFTKGKWKVYQDNMAQITDVVVEDGIGFFHKIIAHICRKDEDFEANANLIAAAVNACQEVNPDNPMAVAESIKDMLRWNKLKVVKGQ